MTADESKHAVLLDALEAAGFPRASLSAPGNALVWKDGDIIAAARSDGNMWLTLKAGGVTIAMDFNKPAAQQLGAFLLAWGYAP